MRGTTTEASCERELAGAHPPPLLHLLLMHPLSPRAPLLDAVCSNLHHTWCGAHTSSPRHEPEERAQTQESTSSRSEPTATGPRGERIAPGRILSRLQQRWSWEFTVLCESPLLCCPSAALPYTLAVSPSPMIRAQWSCVVEERAGATGARRALSAAHESRCLCDDADPIAIRLEQQLPLHSPLVDHTY